MAGVFPSRALSAQIGQQMLRHSFRNRTRVSFLLAAIELWCIEVPLQVYVPFRVCSDLCAALICAESCPG
jgi:hypothetical protein